MTYLDYNASVPLRPCAQHATVEGFSAIGNPSSPHLAGRKVRSLIEDARKIILQNVRGQRLVFTSGGTEANGLALTGLGILPLVVSAIEHESVLKVRPAPSLVSVTRAGVIDLDALEKCLASFETAGLLSLMAVNNETGVIQPLKEATSLAHAKGWKVHTDASQALGHIPLSFEEWGVDMMTLSSHKCGGPIGIGALVLKEDIHLQPLIQGGGQEYGMRSGTISAPLVLGFAAAVTEAMATRDTLTPHLRRFQAKVEESLPAAVIYGKDSPRGAHVLSLGMPGVPADLQLMSFDLQGIAISVGSACSSGKTKESHVLVSMGVPPEEVRCAIRMSMGWNTTEDDIDHFIEVWDELYTSHRRKEATG